MRPAYCHVTETEEGIGLIEVTGTEYRWTKRFVDFDTAMRAASVLRLIPPGMAQVASRARPGYLRAIRGNVPSRDEVADLADLTAAGFLVERVPLR